MAIITFCNNKPFRTGQTHSALAVATHMAIEHNYRILLASTGYNDQVTMQAFGINELIKSVNKLTNNKKSMELESGIEGMAKLALSNRLTADLVPNYTRVIFKKRLEILAGPRDRRDEKIDYEKIYGSTKYIVNIARQYYDLVLVDLNHGLDDPTTREILKLSDVIVMNIEQKMSDADEVMQLREDEKELFALNKTLVLINRYDRESKYNTKNLTKYINEKKEILAIPYNHLYAEAVQEGTVAEMFLNPKIRKLDDTQDRTAFFISEIKRVEAAFIYKMQELQLRIL